MKTILNIAFAIKTFIDCLLEDDFDKHGEFSTYCGLAFAITLTTVSLISLL